MLRLLNLAPRPNGVFQPVGVACGALSHRCGNRVLGQPFSAEVELLGLTTDDMLTAQTRIASREE